MRERQEFGVNVHTTGVVCVHYSATTVDEPATMTQKERRLLITLTIEEQTGLYLWRSFITFDLRVYFYSHSSNFTYIYYIGLYFSFKF